MIVSFKGRWIEAVSQGQIPKGFPTDLVRRTRALLTDLSTVEELVGLQTPPGNRLEALKGDRAGQHSVRVNRQWRLCFVWTDEGPAEVEFVDYHG